MKKASILLPWESYLFLLHKQQMERRGYPLSESVIEKLKRNFDLHYPSGYKPTLDGDCGGSRNGKWVSWPCEYMRMILDAERLPYKDGGEVNVIEF